MMTPALALLAYFTFAFFLSRILKRNDLADVFWGPGFVVLWLPPLPLIFHNFF
jgi:steroid 5-alpha reductase family enzyme